MDNKEKNIPLATEIIRTLKKIIFALIITNILTVAGFLWYISLPIEVATETVTLDSGDMGNNNYISNSEVGDVNNGENDSTEDLN